MYTIELLDKYIKEHCEGSKSMLEAWDCLSGPAKKSDALFPNRFTHWNCGATNASLMMTLSYVNLLGRPTFRTDAIALAAKAAAVDMKEVEKKTISITEKNLFVLVKNPILTPAAQLIFYLCQQAYRSCKGDKLARAIDSLTENGVIVPIETDRIDATIESIMQIFSMMFLKIESDMIQRDSLTSDTAQRTSTDIETSINKKLRKNIALCNKQFDTMSSEHIATLFLLAIASGSTIHKSAIGNAIISYMVASQAPFIPFHSMTGDDLPTMEYYPALPFTDDFSLLQKSSLQSEEDDQLVVKGEVLPFLTEYRVGCTKFLPQSRRVDNFITASTGRPFYGDDFRINARYLKLLRARGFTEQEARDAALIMSVINRVNSVQYSKEYDCGGSYTLTPDEERPTSVQQPPKDSVPLEKYTALERRVKAMDSEIQSLNHQINELQKLLEEKELRIKDNEELIDTYEKVLQEYDRGENDALAKNETCAEEVSFPATINKNVVVYGGFDNFRSSLSELLPDVNIIPHTNLSTDMTPFRNADIIFIQVNYLSYSKFYSIRDFAKANNIPLRTLRTAGAKSCAKYIIEETASL